MRHNLAKCVFGVTSGKFLSFIVFHKGIEANSDKIHAVLDLPSSCMIKEIQSLAGRIVPLSRFVSRSIEWCLPFFKVLCQSQTTQWNQDCQDSFQQLKAYLTSPPLLTSPTFGDILYLYLSASPMTVGFVLVREEGAVQRPIYYTS